MQLSAQQLDLWEHAALLYHSYEWQTAAEFFVKLATDIEDVGWSSRCCLNAVLVVS